MEGTNKRKRVRMTCAFGELTVDPNMPFPLRDEYAPMRMAEPVQANKLTVRAAGIHETASQIPVTSVRRRIIRTEE